jgi:arylsulfatase A
MQKSPVFTSSLIVSCLVTPMLAQPFPMPERPPNIVIILTDDLGYNDIGAYAFGDGTNPTPYTNSSYNPLPGPNRAELLTPRIDSLATEGIRLTNYYSSNPQCSPARAALLTGSYGYRVGIPDVLQPYSKRPDRGNGLHHDELTIAELLKERGYATGAIGKWHLGDVLQYLPTRHGFDTWFGIPFNNDMWPLNPNFGPWPDLPLWEDEATVNYTTDTGGSITSPVSTTLEQQYLLEAMTEKAIDFIDTHQTEPFFLYFSPHVPHVPCWPHPDFVNDSGVSYYYDVIMELDFRVGQILDKLDTLGLADDTLVIFTSDNGPWISRHNPDNSANSAGSAYPLWGGKSEAWEGGSRVPFLARFPGQIPAGVVSDAIGEHVDLLPTLVKLADGDVPTDRTLDGGDLWPVLAQQPGAVSPDNQTFYFKSTTLYGVREGDWKYWSTSGFGASAGDLFDLSTDIQERSNVTSQPAIESDLASLRTTFWKEINANQRPSGSFSAQGIVIDASTLTVGEGGTAVVNVSLVQSPGGTVSVTATYASGDADLSVSAGGILSFDSGNWSTPQSVTIAAAEDADMLAGVGVIELSSPGLPSRFVYATETDNDSVPGVEPGLVWPKVTYATLQDASGTQSLIDNLSATSLEQATINIAPVIDPGVAQSTAYSVNSITLAGFVSDDGQIKAYRETTGTLEPQTLAEWAVAESIPGGQQGPGDNPDGDRWINLWEFAFGLDPNAPEYGPAPWTHVVVDANSPQIVTFTVPRDRLPDISLESSTNLSPWAPTGSEPVITPVDADWNEWTYTVTPDSGWERLFLRLMVAE